MTKFKKGDLVQLTKIDSRYSDMVGDTGKVVRYVNQDLIAVRLDDRYGLQHHWHEHYMKLLPEEKVYKKGETMSATTRYYRVIKDHPAFEMGAVLSDENYSKKYQVTDSVFLKEVEGIESCGYYEGGTIVENQPEWFERVYPISDLKKKLFGTRKQAQAAAAVLYEGGTDDKKA